jgi:hypothetical protein
MAEQKQGSPIPQPAETVPPIPPRTPKGKGDWLVFARHTPLVGFKGCTVQATSPDEAWRGFLSEADKSIEKNAQQYGKDGIERSAGQGRARDWLNAARRERPEGVEIIGAEYSAARKKAMRIKGVVRQDKIGFPELASV